MDVKDSNGNVLKDGDSVILIKHLKVKGAGQTLKHGTKSRSFASPIMKTKLIATTKKSKAWCCALSS